MTLVCCNAVFSEVSEVSEVDVESMLLSLGLVKDVKRALSFNMSVPFLVKLNKRNIVVENGEESTYYRLFVNIFLAAKCRM